MPKILDLTGNKYGRWTVIKKAETSKKDIEWNCVCECGNIGVIRGSSLRSGNSKSCGCLSREMASKRFSENPKPKSITNLSGMKFGKLTVIEIAEHIKGKHIKWRCVCDCGKEVISAGVYLTNGSKTHCGCEKPFSYRLSYHRLHRIWSNMKFRCNNANDDRYDDYGGRGIAVCKEWQESFEVFCKWALKNGYDKNLTLDRIDVNGNYEPSNCRWITMFDQMGNMRKNVHITYKGETKHLSEWCRILNVRHSTIAYRLKNGYSVEEAFEIPIGNYKSRK